MDNTNCLIICDKRFEYLKAFQKKDAFYNIFIVVEMFARGIAAASFLFLGLLKKSPKNKKIQPKARFFDGSFFLNHQKTCHKNF
jgi:hypothetical protein